LTKSEVRFLPVDRQYMPDIVRLLQDISVFLPKEDELEEIWSTYSSQDAVHSIVAVNQNDEVVAFGTLLIETKIRGGKLGHVEDIVVREDRRGSGLGKEIVSLLSALAERHGCYKLVLNCSTSNAGFYESSGLEINGVSMQRLL
jgi:glucosamine-phosphate N-acetyltransferase